MTPLELLTRSPSSDDATLEAHLRQRLGEAELNIGGPITLFLGPSPQAPKRYLTVRVLRTLVPDAEMDHEAHIHLTGLLAIAASDCRFSIISIIDAPPVLTMILRRRLENEYEKAVAASMSP